MEIPGSASFTNQPTITNPLNNENKVIGQQTEAVEDSEVNTSVTINEQSPLDLSLTQIVNPTNQTEGTGLTTDNPGGNIDITV